MRIHAPSAPLAPFVREFMIVDVGEETTRLRLPEPGLVLGVRYRGWASLVAGDRVTRLPEVSLAAMSATARQMRTSAGGGVVLARFHPGGAAQFFPEPLHDLFGTTVALDQLLPAGQVDRIHAAVSQATSDRERVAALQAFLLARLRPVPPDPLVVAAVRALQQARGGLPIRALARQLGISQDPLRSGSGGRWVRPPSNWPPCCACATPSTTTAPTSRWPGWPRTPAISTSPTSTGSSAPSSAARRAGCCAPAASAEAGHSAWRSRSIGPCPAVMKPPRGWSRSTTSNTTPAISTGNSTIPNLCRRARSPQE